MIVWISKTLALAIHERQLADMVAAVVSATRVCLIQPWLGRGNAMPMVSLLLTWPIWLRHWHSDWRAITRP